MSAAHHAYSLIRVSPSDFLPHIYTCALSLSARISRADERMKEKESQEREKETFAWNPGPRSGFPRDQLADQATDLVIKTPVNQTHTHILSFSRAFVCFFFNLCSLLCVILFFFACHKYTHTHSLSQTYFLRNESCLKNIYLCIYTRTGGATAARR